MVKELWSAQISENFSLKLPADARAWFDSDELPDPPDARFNQRIPPSDLLDPESGAVWGGLMLPDTLPLIADGGGNVLGLRVGFDGSVSEIIEWDHEGGWWKPFGQSLAEALLLDPSLALVDQNDSDEPPDPFLIEESFSFAEWATNWIDGLDSSQLNGLLTNLPNLPKRLAEFGIAPVAIAQHECRRLLTTKLEQLCRRVGGGKIAKSLGVEWQEFRPWLSEPRLIPEDRQQPLSRLASIPFADLIRQDWEAAAAEAQAVLAVRTDLAWPFAVLGRFSSEQNDTQAAGAFYSAGLETPGSSEDFIANWKAGFENQTKFIPNALRRLKQNLPQEQEEYLQLFFSTKPLQNVREYWLKRGAAAEAVQQFQLAYRCYYNAGWDLPFSNDMAQVLERLESAATNGGFTSLARLARHHRLAIK